MTELLKYIWIRFRDSFHGRCIIGALVGAFFGFPAGAGISRDVLFIGLAGLGGAAMGALAVGILEFRDRRRSRQPQWKQRVEQRKAMLQELFPTMESDHASNAARTIEENRFTPIIWIAMIVGSISLLFGLLSIVSKPWSFLLNL